MTKLQHSSYNKIAANNNAEQEKRTSELLSKYVHISLPSVIDPLLSTSKQNKRKKKTALSKIFGSVGGKKEKELNNNKHVETVSRTQSDRTLDNKNLYGNESGWKVVKKPNQDALRRPTSVSSHRNNFRD